MFTISACGAGDSTEPAPMTYAVEPGASDTQVEPDGTITITYTIRVTDTGGTRVHGARVRFVVSAGTVTPTMATSGSGGLTSVTWEMRSADYAGKSVVTLSACAQNIDPPTCAPMVIVTLNVN
jgi:hypothetical protein